MIGGCSVLLDGVNDYVSLGNVAARNFTTTPFSIMCWIYPRSVAALARLVHHGTPGANGYSWRVTNLGALVFGTSSPAETTSSTANGQIVANKWQHVAVTRSGASVRLYVNGNDLTSVAGSHSNPTSILTTTYVGANVPAAADWFSGAIDEPAFFNVALTQEQIRELMWLSIPSSYSGLVSLHHFDDGLTNYASVTAVASVSGVNGSLVNGATWVFDRWAPWVESRVSSTADLAIASDTATQVAGTLRNFIPRVKSRMKLTAIFDFWLTTAGTGFILGLVRVDGSALAPQVILAAPAGTPLIRLPAAQVHTFDWDAETLHSVDLAGRLNAAANTVRGTFMTGHTGYAMVAETVDGTW